MINPPGTTLEEPDAVPTVCMGCGRSVWLSHCCAGYPVVEAVVHLARESSVRKGAFRLICRASMRGDDFHTALPDGPINCLDCRRILEREARAAA